MHGRVDKRLSLFGHIRRASWVVPVWVRCADRDQNRFVGLIALMASANRGEDNGDKGGQSPVDMMQREICVTHKVGPPTGRNEAIPTTPCQQIRIEEIGETTVAISEIALKS